MKKLSQEKNIDMSDGLSIAFKIKKDVLELIEKSANCITDRVNELQSKSESMMRRVKALHGIITEALENKQKCVENTWPLSISRLLCFGKVNT